jgi:hypothetical protein
VPNLQSQLHHWQVLINLTKLTQKKNFQPKLRNNLMQIGKLLLIKAILRSKLLNLPHKKLWLRPKLEI